MADQKNDKQKSILSEFIMKDIKSIGTWFVHERLIPIAKKTILDAFNGVMDGVKGAGSMLLFGDGNAAQPKQGEIGYDYNKCYNPNKPKQAESKANRGFSFDIVPYETREKAESVLKLMRETLAQGKRVSIADYYEFSDGRIGPYGTNNYGWRDLTGASISVNSDAKFVINLPAAIFLND